MNDDDLKGVTISWDGGVSEDEAALQFIDELRKEFADIPIKDSALGRAMVQVGADTIAENLSKQQAGGILRAQLIVMEDSP